MPAPAIELTTGARRFVIGDGWVASRLYLNPDFLDDILTPIPAALRGVFEPPPCWVTRSNGSNLTLESG
jgi:hypothetical protein